MNLTLGRLLVGNWLELLDADVDGEVAVGVEAGAAVALPQLHRPFLHVQDSVSQLTELQM